jgi:hypothetical protein
MMIIRPNHILSDLLFNDYIFIYVYMYIMNSMYVCISVLIIVIIIVVVLIIRKKYICERFGNANKKISFDTVKKIYNKNAEELFTLFNSMGLEWWPTEGTLIGILRYGSNFGKLPSIGEIATDTDIDIMVRVESDKEWKELSANLINKITKIADFNKCTLMHAGNPTIDNSPKDKLACYTKYYFGDCYIHTDIHRYLVNENENYAYVNTVNNNNSYPFQHWNNKIPYRGMITDMHGKMRHAKYNSVIVPCPYKASEILQYWNGGEYEKDNISYPVGGVVYKNNDYKFINNETSAPFTLTKSDKDYLHKTWSDLQNNGFESFTEPSSLSIESFNNNNNNILTIVTAFIEITSKHSKSEYKTWMKNLLSHKGPMVIYVDSKNYDVIYNLRHGLPTEIIRIELNELYCNKYRGKFNHESGYYYSENIHNTMNLDDYSIIMSEKVNFLKKATESNNFGSMYYMWLDIGYLRNNTMPLNWPNINTLNGLNDKIGIMSLHKKKCMKKKKKKMYTYAKPPNNVLITGGYILCNKNNVNQLYNLFYNKLEELIEKKEWAGMEQFILSHIYCENQELFHVIEAKKHKLVNNDKWFYAVPYFM